MQKGISRSPFPLIRWKPPANTKNCYSTLDFSFLFSHVDRRLIVSSLVIDPPSRLEERILRTRSPVGQIPLHYENYGSIRNAISTFSFRSSIPANSFLGCKINPDTPRWSGERLDYLDMHGVEYQARLFTVARETPVCTGSTRGFSLACPSVKLGFAPLLRVAVVCSL